MAHKHLNKAKQAKKDEFYTQLPDIEKELHYYRKYFPGKTIFLNCDDPEKSMFWVYFGLNFEFFKLKKLIATHFDRERPTYKLELTKGVRVNKDGSVNWDRFAVKTPLQGNGDFRSPECIELLKEADIVVTNPPFSLFREYIAQLMEYGKKFIIMGNVNNITYKEVFPLIKDNKVWVGRNFNKVMEFRVPKKYKTDKTYINDNGEFVVKNSGICWFTNLDHGKRQEELLLYKTYKGNEDEYPKYDNYDAIEVGRVTKIPLDYEGVMGVPITFLDKWNPDQFDLIWQASGNTRASTPKHILDRIGYTANKKDRGGCAVCKSRRKYGRIFIKHKNPEKGES